MKHRLVARAAIAAATAAMLTAVGAVHAPASAQGLSFGGANNDLPVEILADEGVEWQQEKFLFVARGNAKAIRGEVTVYGDELRAYYRELPEGGTEIWRLDAIGNAKITSPDETATGDRAVYNVDQQILVLTGSKVRFETGPDVLIADRQLEYWELKKMAVARGNALAVRQDKKLWGDVLAAYFRPDKNGDDKVYRVDAFDEVRIRTATDTATGDRGVYNVETGIATLTGSVTLTRGRNKLRGCRSETNLNTGISNLYSCPKGSGSGRVSGVLQPSARNKKKAQPEGQPGAGTKTEPKKGAR